MKITIKKSRILEIIKEELKKEASRRYNEIADDDVRDLKDAYYAIGDNLPTLVKILKDITSAGMKGFQNDYNVAKRIAKEFEKISLGKDL